MERTTSTERVIPIEIIGHVNDVSEDEIDIDNFVESINSKINIHKAPNSDNENENSSSNRASLIITHEDGSTEENECTVTCLGISSDLGTQGLQIEEISQDTLKDKLADEKLKVVIPDMSQVIILEADEVTDASFVSTPEVAESSLADELSFFYDDITMYDIDYEKEESSTPRSITPATTYKMTPDKIQHQKEGRPKEQDLIEAVDSLNVNCNSEQGDNHDKTYDLTENIETPDNAQAQTACGENLTICKIMMPEEEIGSMQLLENVKTLNIEQQITEIQGQCETPSEESGQQHIKKNRKSSIGECKSIKSKENESTSVANSQTVESKDIKILEIQINLDNEFSPEYNIYKQISKESDRSEEIRRFVEPINKDDLIPESKSQKISVAEAKDQDKLPLKKVIAETVRIIPITLPDGRFVEMGILSDHCVNQMEYNNIQLPDIENEVKYSSNIDHDIDDRNIKARTIPILIEAPEKPSTLKDSEKDANDENTFEKKEEGPRNANPDNHTESFAKSSQSTEKLSETMSMKSCTEEVNQSIESKEISKSCSNILTGNFENKELQDATIRNTIQLSAEDELIDGKQEHSNYEIDKESIHSLKDRRAVKQKPDTPINMAELDNKTLNTLSDDCTILAKNMQTEATQQGNTCSDTASGQLAKDLENEREKNVPVLIHTDSENEREKRNENKTTNSGLINNGKDKKEESNTQMNCSISTESYSSPMSMISSEETQNRTNNVQISGELSVLNKKKNENDQNATSKELVKERSVSIEVTDSSVRTDELNITVNHTGMEDFSDREKKMHPEGTEKENTGSNKLHRKSSEVKIVANKLVRNIPILIEATIEVESENIHKNESPVSDQPIISNAENGECEKSTYIGNANQISEDSSLKARYERNENPPFDMTPVSPSSSVMRTVPIQIVHCASTELEDPHSNIKAKTRSNIADQTQRQIPIQRVVENNDRNSAEMKKENKIENKTQLCESSQDPKSDSSIVEDPYYQIVKQQTLPRNQKQGSISVPIEIELQDETIGVQSTKEANNEWEATDSSQETHTSTILNQTSAESEPNKDSCMNSSRFPPAPPLPTSKPPVVRTIPILRQSMSDSGEGMPRNQTGTRQRNKSEQSTREDILQKVHQELEEARAKLTAQANSLSSGLENMPKPVANKNDPRSRSVESEQRYQGAKPKDVKPRNLFKRERSLLDIDKDIETIWKELQELDKPDMENEISTQRRNSFRNSNRAKTPLSEQVLVTPSWRTPTPPPPSQSVRTSLSNSNISNVDIKNQTPIPRTTSPYTIWDTQNKQGPKSEATNSGQLSSSWDSKPQYIPTKSSKHFGFTPKAETKPGVITPSYVSQSPKSDHPQARNIPIEKSNVPLNNGKELQKETIRTKQAYESSRVYKSEESLKSCIKSEASTQSTRKGSQSPSNVKFFNKRKSVEKAQKPSGRNSEADPPFEWVDFRKADGEIVKGTILPPLHRDNDVVISREVPIINVLLDDAMYEDTNTVEKNKPTIIKEKETKIPMPSKQDNRDKKDNPSSDVFNACDAGTQTEKFEKKGGCHIM